MKSRCDEVPLRGMKSKPLASMNEIHSSPKRFHPRLRGLHPQRGFIPPEGWISFSAGDEVEAF